MVEFIAKISSKNHIGAARFRRLARDDERLPETFAGLHFMAFACLMRHRLITVVAQRP